MIAQTSVVARYVVTAGVLSYAVPFPIYGEEDVRVTVSTDGKTETALVLGTDYTVAILASGGGTVTLTGGRVPVGAALAVASAIPATQEADFSATTDVNTNALETQLDRQVQMIQQLEDGLSRAVKVPAASGESPEALGAALFEARDEAENAAAQAGQSAKEAKASAAETAEIKADALREVREEGEAQSGRLKNLADGYVLTFEREVERASQEADRAEAAADRAESSMTLGEGVTNVERTYVLQQAIAAGDTVTLEGFAYYVGRATLRLNWEGVELFRGVQFEEVGTDGAVSHDVKFLTDIPLGDRLNAWAVASNVARGVKEAEEAARVAAKDAQASAIESAEYAKEAEKQACEAGNQVKEAATQTGIAQDAAQEATEQADRAEAAATDAENAARKAQAARCGLGIAVLRDAAGLEDAPGGFYVLDPSLSVLCVPFLPLNTALSVADIPDLDGFYFTGLEPHCPDPCPPAPEPEPTSLCGQRKKLLAQ